jgi:hypothetical protein
LPKQKNDTNIIVGVASHDKNIHNSKTLNVAISHANSNRNKPIKQAVSLGILQKISPLFFQNKKIATATIHFGCP